MDTEVTHEFLRSSFFKIVLKDAKATLANCDNHSPSADRSVARQKKSEFYVHRDLLASLSPELDKHVNNNMKEGLEGVMELSDVDDPTMKAFLVWAYTKDYTPPLPKSTSALLQHIKLYALADRFNTSILKDLAYSKITAYLSHVGMVSDEEDVSAILFAITYAFENLPCTTENKTSLAPNAVPSEKLLKYLAQYTAWSLDVFRGNSEFGSLLHQYPDLATALVMLSHAAATPPWMEVVPKVADDQKASKVAVATNHVIV
ncbi:hypothetical protein BDZ91DRAFT_853279 [Kalaharituber pfeilii]|nr:hypothetical protein BDZ91DRAFT_853279 [Kalaharituber pfeilii]